MIKTGVGAIEVRRESEKIAAEAIGYRVWPFEVESTPIKSDDDVIYNTMTKVELLAYALDKFDVDLRDRDTKSSLIEQIIALENK